MYISTFIALTNNYYDVKNVLSSNVVPTLNNQRMSLNSDYYEVNESYIYVVFYNYDCNGMIDIRNLYFGRKVVYIFYIF